MKVLNILIVLFLLQIVTFLKGGTIEKSLSVYVIEEQIAGIRFTHRSDLIDGKSNEIWAISGRPVSVGEYEEAILNAERDERRAERKAQEERRKQGQEFKAKAHYTLLKKLGMAQAAEIVKGLIPVKEPLLEPFLQFSESTFSSRDVLHELEQELEIIHKLCESSNLEEMVQLGTLLKKIELYPARLAKLYQESVNSAIKTCDDTRALKELLKLVS